MNNTRHTVDERGHMRPDPEGAWILFGYHELVKASSDKGWALAKSLQAQVDILRGFVDKVIDAPADSSLTSVVARAQATLSELQRHKES